MVILRLYKIKKPIRRWVFCYPEIYLNNRNNPQETAIVTGSVSIQADKIVLIVFVLRLLTPFDATIDPAIPEFNMCVVDTGNLKAVDKPIVQAASNARISKVVNINSFFKYSY